jgi:FtsZ-interacting cell division protein ZipA
MSDLQLSLLAVGAVVVAGVYMFNWTQERRLRRRLKEAFGEERDDVLLETSAPAAARVEPQLGAYSEPAAEDVAEAPEIDAAPAAALEREVEPRAAVELPDVPGFDEALDYIVEIRAGEPLGAAAIGELLAKLAIAVKPCRAAGYSEDSAEWEDLARTADGRYAVIRLALQLVTRGGALDAAQLSAFVDAMRAWAERAGAEVSLPDAQQALQQARALDGFCADVDIAIGINIVAQGGTTFPGTQIRAHAEAAGFNLEPDGVFHYRDGERRTLFTLDNHEPAPFIPEQIKSLSTTGVTLLLDVPRVADGQRVLALMVETAQRLADTLGGQLVDDNRVALNASGIASIRQQLDGIAASMAAHGIPPGGGRALRLFS